ncbi:hypothetical protein ACSQ6I_18540 [Anabaena sp. WFMT]|uniref:hypothetical protein n=1 Tax=Anabaena sp. WFMT TaxID=3449730 RepID=UPI003F24C9FB
MDLKKKFRKNSGVRSQESGVRRKKKEERRKKEEGRRKKEEGRRKKEEGRRKNIFLFCSLLYQTLCILNPYEILC